MSDVVWWFMDMVSDGRLGVGVVEAVPPQQRSKSPRSKRWGEGGREGRRKHTTTGRVLASKECCGL